MEILKIQDLSFRYTESKTESLKNINLTINEGELLLICGPSGCGKTTLLKEMKNLLKYQGVTTGSISFKGTDISSLPDKDLVAKLGYVFQNPDNQIVCDTPIMEMAFGLENLGTKPDEIRRRIAEMASYFGIVKHLHKDVNTLSGGQKQLLNLASVMVMQPDVLLLDEPTSMLDPVACSEFVSIINKLNKELGLTIIIVEHNLESLYSMADRVCYMENGEIIKCDEAVNVASFLINENKKMVNALPTTVLMNYKLKNEKELAKDVPLTVRDGRNYLIDYVNQNPTFKPSPYVVKAFNNDPVIKAKGVYFRYSKDTPDILKDINISVNRGEFFSVHGDNGSGKTTLLKVLSGINKPYAGRFKAEKCAYLPQNQLLAFVKDDIHEDIVFTADNNGIDHRDIGDMIEHIPFFHDVPLFYGRNPLDLSGGEQQKLALFKLLLTKPKIILLDEPTKGLDSFAKKNLADLLLGLKENGTTIVMVSHDLDFSAKYADTCGLFFDGTIVSKTNPLEFFTTNHFYSTTTARITRGIVENTVNLEQFD